jgi:hypothetical protein
MTKSSSLAGWAVGAVLHFSFFFNFHGHFLPAAFSAIHQVMLNQNCNVRQFLHSETVEEDYFHEVET